MLQSMGSQRVRHNWATNFILHFCCSSQASLFFTISQCLLKLMSIESMLPSNHLILCHPHLFLPSIFPSIRVFSIELALCIRWPKYWGLSLISLCNEYSELISFRIDWFDLLAVQGTLKSLLQHHSSKALILQPEAIFYGPTPQSVHDYWKDHCFDYMDLYCTPETNTTLYIDYTSKKKEYKFMHSIWSKVDFKSQLKCRDFTCVWWKGASLHKPCRAIWLCNLSEGIHLSKRNKN